VGVAHEEGEKVGSTNLGKLDQSNRGTKPWVEGKTGLRGVTFLGVKRPRRTIMTGSHKKKSGTTDGKMQTISQHIKQGRSWSSWSKSGMPAIKKTTSTP